MLITLNCNLKRMNITIFTDESGVKLPEIKKWKNSFGRGVALEKDEEILNLLKKNGLSIPLYDFELEENYREVLCPYIRPAKNMFAGMFAEVRDFNEYLSESLKSSFYIISGRYGLLAENESIIPYSSHIKDETDLVNLSRRTDFTQKMLVNAKYSDVILIFLPSHFINYLLTVKWFDHFDSESIIIVSSKQLRNQFSNKSNITVLERKGVARIGVKNREIIMEIIKSLNRKENDINFKSN